MAVTPVVRNVLRGRIRAQAHSAIAVGERLVTAFNKNNELLLFVGDVGPGSVAEFEAILAQWRLALATKA
jgi:hypothetical protein